MTLIGGLIFIVVAAAQGGAVFATAYMGVRLLRISWLGKATAMAISYVAWIGATLAGYTLLGGDGGLMDGFGLVLSLCVTALVSSFAYLLIWSVWPARKAAA